MAKQCSTCAAYEDAPSMGFGYCHLNPRSANNRLKVDDNDYCMSWVSIPKKAKPVKKEKQS